MQPLYVTINGRRVPCITTEIVSYQTRLQDAQFERYKQLRMHALDRATPTRAAQEAA